MVLKLDLVASDDVGLAAENNEASRSCSLVYAANEPFIFVGVRLGAAYCAIGAVLAIDAVGLVLSVGTVGTIGAVYAVCGMHDVAVAAVRRSILAVIEILGHERFHG